MVHAVPQMLLMIMSVILMTPLISARWQRLLQTHVR